MISLGPWAVEAYQEAETAWDLRKLEELRAMVLPQYVQAFEIPGVLESTGEERVQVPEVQKRRRVRWKKFFRRNWIWSVPVLVLASGILLVVVWIGPGKQQVARFTQGDRQILVKTSEVKALIGEDGKVGILISGSEALWVDGSLEEVEQKLGWENK